MIYLYVHLTPDIGLDVLANEKRAGSNFDGSFKIPRERVASIVASVDEDEERSMSSGIDELGNNVSDVPRNFESRKYRESGAKESYSGTFIF